MASTSHSKVEESASSASTSGRSYDVFINHRGPDVKHKLATALYKMLTCGMGLNVFLDSEELELEVGDNLPIELEEAMKSASFHIAIFSENYAQSRWCLDELSFMCRTGAKIVPIFYHVKPEDVRYAKGVYAAAFERHKKKGRFTSEKLQEWKDALSSVSNNIGHIVNNKEQEDMLLKNITYSVVREVKTLPLVVAEHPVGLDEIVKDFESATFMDGRHHNVQIIGIWGVGGSGKTTLAKKLYNDIYPSMEKASLILDIRDAANKNLLHRKQNKLLEDLGFTTPFKVGFKTAPFDNVEEGKAVLARHLRVVGALIVLDDIDHVDQLNALLPGQGSGNLIGLGTLIIVTTRELEVLRCWNISCRYKMKPLSAVHAKQLSCWHAFLQLSPLNGFEELVEKFLKASCGLPLSLKVLGGQLYGCSSKEFWESLLEKISRIAHKDIKDKLKISYDSLGDEEQEVFLDIACYFIGEKSDLAIELWNGSGSNGLYSLEKLRNKCLVEIDWQNFIRMHDQLKDLGREITNGQSPYRLWSPQQKIKISNEQNVIGIRGIKAISDDCLSHGELVVDTNRGMRSLAPSTLGLKFVKARGRNFNHVINEASGDLLWLRWLAVREKNLQSLIPTKNLRILEINKKYSNFESYYLRELWAADCDAPLHLRVLDISDCSNLQGFPKSIGRLKHLKKIVLYQLQSLESLPQEICLLQSLEHLELDHCDQLSSLPNRMGNLGNLRHLSLADCWRLERLPDSCKELTLLQHLKICCLNVTFKSDIMENISKLEFVDFSNCHQSEELPCRITNQASLRILYLSGMRKLRELPVKIGQLRKLQKLYIGGYSLTSLPASLGDLSSLTALFIVNSRGVECLPDTLGRLSLLEELEIRNSGVKFLPESISQLINLERLMIDSCPVSELDLGLCKLKRMHISNNNELSKISIPKDCCAALETLTVEKNSNLREIEGLPSSVRKLFISGCPKLSALPSFAQLTSLRELKLEDCFQVKNTEGLDHCRELEVLKAYTRCIQSLECMERLRTLHLTATTKSVVEGCIQPLQKLPGEMIICTRAVQNAASIVNSLAFPTFSILDSCSNVLIGWHYWTELFEAKQPTNGNAIIVCFVMRPLHKILCVHGSYTKHSYPSSQCLDTSDVELEEGRWVWIGVFTQRSQWYGGKIYSTSCKTEMENGTEEDRVERGFHAIVEENRVWEVLLNLLRVMGI